MCSGAGEGVSDATGPTFLTRSSTEDSVQSVTTCADPLQS